MGLRLGLGLGLGAMNGPPPAPAAPSSTVYDFAAAGAPVTGGANGTRTNASGVIVAASAPRLDYSSGQAATFVERAGTNRVKQSGRIDLTTPWQTYLGGGLTLPLTAQAATAPNGSNDACQIVAPATFAGDNGSAAIRYQPGLPTVASRHYVFSIYVWGVSAGAEIGIVIQDDADNSPIAYRKVSPVQGQWTRYRLTYTAKSGSVTPVFGTPQPTIMTVAGGTVRVWGAQDELGSLPTSYIPTAAAAVTRTAETLTLPALPSGCDHHRFTYGSGNVDYYERAVGFVHSRGQTSETLVRKVEAIALPLTPITGFTLGSITAVPHVAGVERKNHPGGDVWGSCLLDDGTCFMFSDDSRGWGSGGPSSTMQSDFMLSLVDNPLSAADFEGRCINTMAAFGRIDLNGGARNDTPGESYTVVNGPGSTAVATTSWNWKMGDAIRVPDTDTIVAAVRRDHFTSNRQPLAGAQLIASTDLGGTFSPMPPTMTGAGTAASPSVTYPYASPMFPGTKAPGLTFAHYPAHGMPASHKADLYCYSLIFWHYYSGDKVAVQRCLWSNLLNLSAADWQVFQGDGDADGLLDAKWGSDYSGAHAILTDPGKVGCVPMNYDARRRDMSLLTFWFPEWQTATSYDGLNAGGTQLIGWRGRFPWSNLTKVYTSPTLTVNPGRSTYGPALLEQSAIVANAGGDLTFAATNGFAAPDGVNPNYSLELLKYQPLPALA